MIKLYGGQRTRAAIVIWYLEELEIPYEVIEVDIQNGGNLDPSFLAINPFGKVPALVDGDLKLSESGAILMYLAEKNGRLPDSAAARAEFAQWLLFCNSTLVESLVVEEVRKRSLDRVLSALDAHFDGREFLVGDSFSALDVSLATMCSFGQQLMGLDLSGHPNLAGYVGRMASRPGFQKAMGGAS